MIPAGDADTTGASDVDASTAPARVDDTTSTSTADTALTTGSGRAVLGAIAGLLLGLFLWIDLVLFGVIALESVTFWVFPPLGLVAGVLLARWAPFRRS